ATPNLFIAGNGNVGIGTGNPAMKLEVNGDLKLSNSTSKIQWQDFNFTIQRDGAYGGSVHNAVDQGGTNHSFNIDATLNDFNKTGRWTALQVSPIINEAGGGSGVDYTALGVYVTPTSVQGTVNRLLDLQVANATK